VPEAIARLADDGLSDIRFESGNGLEELLEAWPTISKRIL
jgi:hypothetical protein